MSFYVRIGAAAAGFALSVLWGAVLMLVFRDARRVRGFVAPRMARYICWATRINVRLHGIERLEHARGALLTPNQQSLVCYGILAHAYLRVRDPVVVARLTGQWNLPIMTTLFEATGNILVDPANAAVTARGLERARTALCAGSNVFIFPEGTRWGEAARLGPFKPGAFILAIDTGAPIIPIVVSPLRPRTDLPRRRLEPNDVDVHVLEPIETKGCNRNDVDRLRDQVRISMQNELSRLARERGLEVS